MEARFETAFLKAVKKHASIKKLVQKKVDMIPYAPQVAVMNYSRL